MECRDPRPSCCGRMSARAGNDASLLADYDTVRVGVSLNRTLVAIEYCCWPSPPGRSSRLMPAPRGSVKPNGVADELWPLGLERLPYRSRGGRGWPMADWLAQSRRIVADVLQTPIVRYTRIGAVLHEGAEVVSGQRSRHQ